jgi:hypothetical protein
MRRRIGPRAVPGPSRGSWRLREPHDLAARRPLQRAERSLDRDERLPRLGREPQRRGPGTVVGCLEGRERHVEREARVATREARRLWFDHAARGARGDGNANARPPVRGRATMGCMGGPSRESHRAAERARRARRDALRSRGGVVDVAEWRAAVRCAAALEGLLHAPPWLVDVRVAAAEEVGLELVVTLLWESEDARRCLPRSVDDLPVRVVVRNPGARVAYRLA